MKAAHIIASSLLALPLVPTLVAAAEKEDSETVVDRYWQNSFWHAGRNLKCYFTIEKAELVSGEHAIADLGISQAHDIKSIDELLTRLRKENKGFTFVRNTKNPAIIHVIDNRVKQVKNYALEREACLTMTDTLNHISVHLGKKFQDVGPKMFGDSREMGDDAVTRVSLKFEQRKVRDILTDAVPLKDYGPFIWRAETRTFGKLAGTTIQFFGPKATDKALEDR